ncbi:DNA (cytosine-5-)-methyltransferase [Cohnella sp. AR92]|nr:DNA (cytosine-5-)-methyltransferase [Cohnella sp. AR92]
MKALSLFSGIGGIDLACEWAGIETVAFCEREPFPQQVLKKHWPHVPIYDDVCTLTKERLEADGIGTIDLIHGGYPCQPYSLYGEREGAEDDRALWPEVCRLIETIRPSWFLGENVIGHVTLGLDETLSDLGNLGYTAQPFDIPAVSVGALDERRRVFIIAYSNSEQWETPSIFPRLNTKGSPKAPKIWSEFQFYNGGANDFLFRKEDESLLCRADDGVPRELDEPRFKALGNAVNPYQVFPFLAGIKQIDNMMKEMQK